MTKLTPGQKAVATRRYNKLRKQQGHKWFAVYIHPFDPGHIRQGIDWNAAGDNPVARFDTDEFLQWCRDNGVALSNDRACGDEGARGYDLIPQNDGQMILTKLRWFGA